MNLEFLILLAAFIARECFYQYTTHRLVNKLMSRSYFDFEQASNHATLEKRRQDLVAKTFQEDSSIGIDADSLGVLGQFGS